MSYIKKCEKNKAKNKVATRKNLRIANLQAIITKANLKGEADIKEANF